MRIEVLYPPVPIRIPRLQLAFRRSLHAHDEHDHDLVGDHDGDDGW
jgi:hypothetical protein